MKTTLHSEVIAWGKVVNNMWMQYNPNPTGKAVGDCVVRALTLALGHDWDFCYTKLCIEGFEMKDLPSANAVWGNVLRQEGWTRHTVPQFCTLEDMAKTGKRRIVCMDGHVVYCDNGNYYDAWDSGQEIALYYWEEE